MKLTLNMYGSLHVEKTMYKFNKHRIKNGTRTIEGDKMVPDLNNKSIRMVLTFAGQSFNA